jgi:hypothetical protein
MVVASAMAELEAMAATSLPPCLCHARDHYSSHPIGRPFWFSAHMLARGGGGRTVNTGGPKLM